MADPATPMHAMTLDDWAALDEDVAGELVDGRLEEEELPTWTHELVVSWLIGLLRGWVVPRGGFALGSETKLAISPGRGRKPDVVVFFGGRALPPRRASIGSVPPDLVVEVVTARPRDARRDRVEKKPDYARLGVGQYWLLDPEARTLEVLALGADARFVEVLAAAEGAHAVPGCEGLVVDLDDLWAELDRWPDDEA
ncbi:MAG: Uma2 family endonuclease [Sandaracinaceae bacterium]|nr:Uma2 family endonuclease [Sandaracinaceae bacterium]